jgi:large subunit ribosomal protein L22
MGARKYNAAQAMKEARKELYFAKLNNVPTSPRKMRLVADMIRGMEVNRALGALHFSTKHAARSLELVLKSAVANWEVKTGKKADSETLYVTKVTVDGGLMLKRLLTAPQGRGYRVRKRSNHITVFVDTKKTNAEK